MLTVDQILASMRLKESIANIIVRPKDNMKQAGIMMIVKDGLILGISRRDNKEIFGLIGGKKDPEDATVKDAAIRETREEAGVIVDECSLIFERTEPGGADGIDFYSYCYYATDWYGEPKKSEEGEVKWLTVDELTNTKAAFGEYNKQAITAFRKMFPEVYLREK